MDHILKYGEINTLTRELPDDWRPGSGIGVVGVTYMLVDNFTMSADCRPTPGTYASINDILASIQVGLDAFAGGGFDDITISLSLTNYVNITSASPFDVTFLADGLKEILGFTGDLIGGLDYNAPNHPALPGVTPSATATVYSADGTSLDFGAASFPGWYATTAAATRMARTITASAYTASTAEWKPGRRALLYSISGGPVEFIDIESAALSAGVWTLDLRERLNFSHASGVFLIPWWITRAVDCTVVATWTVGRRGTVRWSPTAVFDAYTDIVDTWDLRSALRDVSATERLFRSLFPRIAEVYRDQIEFSILLEDAQATIRARFADTPIDFDALVSMDSYQRLLARQIAWHLAGQGGEELAGEFDRLTAMRAEYFADFEKSVHAQDPNQDSIIEYPTDYPIGEQAPIRRW